jgi:hypothetical protein
MSNIIANNGDDVKFQRTMINIILNVDGVTHSELVN